MGSNPILPALFSGVQRLQMKMSKRPWGLPMAGISANLTIECDCSSAD